MNITVANDKQKELRSEIRGYFESLFGDELANDFSVEAKGNHKWYFTYADINGDIRSTELTKTQVEIMLDNLAELLASGVRNSPVLTINLEGEPMAVKKSALDLLNSALPAGASQFVVGSDSGLEQSGLEQSGLEQQGGQLDVEASSESQGSEDTGSEVSSKETQETNSSETGEEMTEVDENTQDDVLYSNESAELDDVSDLFDDESEVDTQPVRPNSVEIDEDGNPIEVDGEGNPVEGDDDGIDAKAQAALQKKAEKEAERQAKAAQKQAEKEAKAAAKEAEKAATEAQKEANQAKEEAEAESLRAKVREGIIEYAEAQKMGGASQFQEGLALIKLDDITKTLAGPKAVVIQQEEYDKLFGLLANGESKFPNKVSRSNKRATAQAWVMRAGLGIDEVVTHPDFVNAVTHQPQVMTLSTCRAFVSLTALNALVNEGNYDLLMAFANRYPFPLIAKVAKFLEPDNFEEMIESWKDKSNDEILAWADMMSSQGGTERNEPSHKSLRLQSATYNAFINTTFPGVADIIKEALGDRDGITEEFNGSGASVTEVFEIMRKMIGAVSHDWMRNFVLNEYGKITPDQLVNWRSQTDNGVISLDSIDFYEPQEEQTLDDGESVDETELPVEALEDDEPSENLSNLMNEEYSEDEDLEF